MEKAERAKVRMEKGRMEKVEKMEKVEWMIRARARA